MRRIAHKQNRDPGQNPDRKGAANAPGQNRDRQGAAVGPCGPRAIRRARVSALVPAFTLVELILVVAVIVLVLAIAVPGLSTMNAEARLTSAHQTINGVTRQAYLMAQADRALTAVRFLPGEWDVADADQQQSTGGQHLAIYTYVGTMTQESPPGSGNFQIMPGEYFERAKDLQPVRLPEDVWAAPLEALAVNSFNWNNYGAAVVLTGQIGTFQATAPSNPGAGSLLNADDFLIVCDPDAGVRAGTPRAYRMRAFDPLQGFETTLSGTAVYKRLSASGVVTYRREAFEALGKSALGLNRQKLLRSRGRAYIAHRFSGGLLSGAQRPE